MPLQQLTLTQLTLTLNFFRTNNALITTRNKYTANDVSCLRMSMISYVLNVAERPID